MGLQPGIDYNYLKAESKLVFSNKSEILFRHLEEPDKLKSLNLGFVELEEMSDIIKEDVFDVKQKLVGKYNVSIFKYPKNMSAFLDSSWLIIGFIKLVLLVLLTGL